ncbi:SsgA family sporulation/cell division regulator [Streptomyces sp. bgisy027]|uniref:SsgA family sporulation/cell division regulator n=1 Tax=Streptomyces sp. bgisy027 TaxID=3413770 RepID=UPI003D757BDB
MPLRLHTDEYDTGRVLPARFTYRRMDPYAIEVVFRPHSPRAKSWVFARDLLLDGLHRSTGEGDVIVWPRPGPSSSNCSTFIRLKTPQGTALLSASQTDLESYLEQTQQAVPSGAEHQHMSDALNNLERELAALTSGAVG